MFEEMQPVAEVVGWPLAACLTLLFLADRMGLVSVKVGGAPKNTDERIDKLTAAVEALNLKMARIEAILEERAR